MMILILTIDDRHTVYVDMCQDICIKMKADYS